MSPISAMRGSDMLFPNDFREDFFVYVHASCILCCIVIGWKKFNHQLFDVLDLRKVKEPLMPFLL